MKKILKDIILEAKKYVTNDLTFEEIKWLLQDELSLKDYELITLKNEYFECDDFFLKLNKAQTIPVSYLLNYQNFYGYKFYVDSNVLIPRNETEQLVEMVLNFIKESKMQSVKIVEIGSGSGCISIALNKELEKNNIINDIISGDISLEALKIANKNSNSLKSNVKFILSNCLDNITGDFDILVSNPPYINKNNYVSKRVLENEPHIALFAEEDGLIVYKKIFSQAKNINALFFEISPDLVEGLEKLKDKYLKNYTSQYLKDINGFIRFAIYKK